MKTKLLLLFLVIISVTVKGQSFNMCSGTMSTSSPSGYIYDSGGPSGNYSSYENCSFLIKANCPGNIVLTFSSFSTELNYDYITIYDGNNTSAPILGGYWGTGNIPPLTATSGSMLITFYSDGSGNYSGFAASWASNQNCAPISNFNTQVNACQGKVTCSDASTNNPYSWLWNFGDGNASTLQNPVHTYTAPGVYSINLVATNNYGNSTITKTVSVNPIAFSIGYNGLPLANSAISFTTNNTTGQVYTWTFGDGGLGGTANAIHTYTALGNYNVGLTIASGSCVTTSTMQVAISGVLGIHQSYIAPYNASIEPNPFVGHSQLKLQMAESRKVKIEVLNQLGQLIRVICDEPVKAGEYQFELNDLPAGIHYIKISEGENSKMLKVVSL